MVNEQKLRALRPELSLTTADSTPMEAFQNSTLRPLLKMQHDLLLARIRHYISKRKLDFGALEQREKRAFLEQSVRQDQLFRQSLAGMMIGHFTAAEMAFFLENESDCMRRLGDLLVQRLQSATDMI